MNGQSKIKMTNIEEDIKEYINRTLIPMISCDENVEPYYKWELHSITPTYFILRNYSRDSNLDDEDEFIRNIIVTFNRDGSWIIDSNKDINDKKGRWNVNYKYFARSTQYFYALYQLMKHGLDNELLVHLSKMYKEWNNTPSCGIFTKN